MTRGIPAVLIAAALAVLVTGCEHDRKVAQRSSSSPPDARVITYSPDRSERFVGDANTGTSQQVDGPLDLGAQGQKSFSVSTTSANEIEIADQGSEERRSFELDSDTTFDAWSVSADGSKLATVARRSPSGSDAVAVVRVFDMASGESLNRLDFRAYSGREMSVGWSPSSDWVFVTQDDVHVVYFRPDDAEASFRVLNTKYAGRFDVTR